MGEKGDPFGCIFLLKKKRMAINVLTAYLFPYTKSLATRREGLKREPGDGRIINHMAFSFPSPHDAVGFSHSIYLFFSILNISHLSRSPGQRLYVIFWSFFFDFFFSLSHLMELWLSLSWCAGLGVLLQPWLSAANKQEQQTSWFVSVRPVWTGQPSVGCNHPPWEQQPPAAYINFVRFHFILFHSELPNRQNFGRWWGIVCRRVVDF